MPEESGKDGSKAPKKEKKVPEGLVIPPKKPKLTKAERRALQEQQRAAKKAAQEQQNSGNNKEQLKNQGESHGSQKKVQQTTSTSESKKKDMPTNVGHQATAESTLSKKCIPMVSHLTPYQDPKDFFTSGAVLSHKNAPQNLHPAVIETGYLYASGQIRGGNARCRAMLHCYQTVLNDYEPSDDSVDLRPVLDSQILKPAFHYWTEHCRPHSVSMGNAFTFLKTAVASLDRDLSFTEIRQVLNETITAYERERIDYADRAIAEIACQKLLKDQKEVLLIYGCSEVIKALLEKAFETKKEFHVILVDSRPMLEGRKQLEYLRAIGIECSYILLNALTYVLQDVTKVLLGASALMSDGSVCGRLGSAAVAMAAHAQNVPVLVLSETYKISNRVQLESITSNELGDPNALATESFNQNLKLLNLMYDLTPAEFVSGIVTELGIIPPTSVAVLLREMNPQEIKRS